jgi:hypothetical protein
MKRSGVQHLQELSAGRIQRAISADFQGGGAAVIVLPDLFSNTECTEIREGVRNRRQAEIAKELLQEKIRRVLIAEQAIIRGILGADVDVEKLEIIGDHSRAASPGRYVLAY